MASNGGVTDRSTIPSLAAPAWRTMLNTGEMDPLTILQVVSTGSKAIIHDRAVTTEVSTRIAGEAVGATTITITILGFPMMTTARPGETMTVPKIVLPRGETMTGVADEMMTATVAGVATTTATVAEMTIGAEAEAMIKAKPLS